MRTIKLDFCNFWKGFNKTDNYFYNLLARKYRVSISDSPDYLIYSDSGPCFGYSKEHLKYKCIRIYYAGEDRRANFKECDYAFTFDYSDDPRNYRLPIYVLDRDPYVLVKPSHFDVDAVFRQKTKFCSFVVSNPRVAIRNRFFQKLCRYKRVDSGGLVFNNIGRRIQDKLTFMKEHKFHIAFESSSHPGYVTEKISQAMLANCVPIYWGDPLIYRDFNPKSFLNYADFGNDEAFIEEIIRVDNDDNLYREYLSQPYYHNNEVKESIKPGNVLKQFDYIFQNDRVPVAQQKKKRLLFF